jgi:hypothetical protein
MAKQSINLGSSANDGGGTTLRAGGDIVNDNFNELYTALGDGTDLKISIGSPSTGDVLTWNGSIFTKATPSTLANIVEDTTPQLGGNLDVNAKQIVSASNNNIVITPNGSGSVVLDGQSWPQADGSANQVLKTDGSGQLSYSNLETVAATHLQLPVYATTSARDSALGSPAAGMMIYLTATNKAQVYNGTAWTDLH